MPLLIWRRGQNEPVRLPTEGESPFGDIKPTGIAFSPDGTRLLVSDSAQEGYVYDAQTLERLVHISPIGSILGFWEAQADFSRDGSRIVGLSGKMVDGQWTGDLARIWDARTGKELVVLRRHENVLSAAFVGTGNRVMTAGGSFIRFWDAANGSELVQIRVREGTAGVVQAAASPDGALVASSDSLIRGAVWDTHTGKQVTELKGARKDTWVSQFTPDGRFVVTHDDIGTVAFRDPTTGELARALHGPPAGIESIDMSASDHRLLAGGYDYTVRMWDTLTDKLLFFADLLPHRTEGFPMIPNAGRVDALLQPSVQEALVKLVMPGTSEPGLLFDLPYNTFDEVVNAAYTAVPYRFTEDERAELELDLFGRPDPRGAHLEVLTQPPPG